MSGCAEMAARMVAPSPFTRLIEHSRRTRFLENLGKEVGGKLGNFAWLQDHGAPSGKRWRHFADHLVHRPVPWSDQPTRSNPLASRLSLYALQT